MLMHAQSIKMYTVQKLFENVMHGKGFEAHSAHEVFWFYSFWKSQLVVFILLLIFKDFPTGI